MKLLHDRCNLRTVIMVAGENPLAVGEIGTNLCVNSSLYHRVSRLMQRQLLF